MIFTRDHDFDNISWLKSLELDSLVPIFTDKIIKSFKKQIKVRVKFGYLKYLLCSRENGKKNTNKEKKCNEKNINMSHLSSGENMKMIKKNRKCYKMNKTKYEKVRCEKLWIKKEKLEDIEKLKWLKNGKRWNSLFKKRYL